VQSGRLRRLVECNPFLLFRGSRGQKRILPNERWLAVTCSGLPVGGILPLVNEIFVRAVGLDLVVWHKYLMKIGYGNLVIGVRLRYLDVNKIIRQLRSFIEIRLQTASACQNT
jgi:hypothetical protein